MTAEPGGVACLLGRRSAPQLGDLGTRRAVVRGGVWKRLHLVRLQPSARAARRRSWWLLRANRSGARPVRRRARVGGERKCGAVTSGSRDRRACWNGPVSNDVREEAMPGRLEAVWAASGAVAAALFRVWAAVRRPTRHAELSGAQRDAVPAARLRPAQRLRSAMLLASAFAIWRSLELTSGWATTRSPRSPTPV